MKHYLGYAWGSINTLIGLIYVLPLLLLRWYSYSHAMKTPKGARALVFIVDFKKAPKWFGRSLTSFWYGRTFGNIIILRDLIDGDSAIHQSVHVDQYMKVGPFALPLYGLGWLAARLVGENAYFMNPFEVAARRYAGQPVDVRPIKKLKRRT